jgi:hypothetical protein
MRRLHVLKGWAAGPFWSLEILHGLELVFGIHEILVRIRIRGSIPLTNGIRFGSVLPCLFEATFTSFFEEKSYIKKSQYRRNEGFLCYFCLMIEGSGAGWIRMVPRTNGSRRPNNIRILRIRIPNTD